MMVDGMRESLRAQEVERYENNRMLEEEKVEANFIMDTEWWMMRKEQTMRENWRGDGCC